MIQAEFVIFFTSETATRTIRLLSLKKMNKNLAPRTPIDTFPAPFEAERVLICHEFAN